MRLRLLSGNLNVSNQPKTVFKTRKPIGLDDYVWSTEKHNLFL